MSFPGVSRHRAQAGSFALPLGAQFRRLIRELAGLARAISGRRLLAELARLDDRMLNDIGLTRSDLREAAAESFLNDPTTKLLGHVAERRAVRRRDARTRATEHGSRKRFVPYY